MKENNDKNKCYFLKATVMDFFLLLLFNPPDRSNGNDNDIDFKWERPKFALRRMRTKVSSDYMSLSIL